MKFVIKAVLFCSLFSLVGCVINPTSKVSPAPTISKKPIVSESSPCSALYRVLENKTGAVVLTPRQMTDLFNAEQEKLPKNRTEAFKKGKFDPTSQIYFQCIINTKEGYMSLIKVTFNGGDLISVTNATKYVNDDRVILEHGDLLIQNSQDRKLYQFFVRLFENS